MMHVHNVFKEKKKDEIFYKKLERFGAFHFQSLCYAKLTGPWLEPYPDTT